MKKHLKRNSPQLIKEIVVAGTVALDNKTKLSLYKKSTNSGISPNILEEVYRRGYNTWNDSFNQTPEQFAFDRVNSFIAGGFAAKLDADLIDQDDKPINETKVQLIRRVIHENKGNSND